MNNYLEAINSVNSYDWEIAMKNELYSIIKHKLTFIKHSLSNQKKASEY